MIDISNQISAVDRTVGARTLPAGEARVVTIAQTYDATAEEVWDACTSAERIPRWFLPVSGDLRLGGRYQLEGNAGGVIERCDPPRGFAATWEYGDEVSWIELRVIPVGDGRTRMELDHLAHVSDERWLQYGPGAVGVGWDLGIASLASHLALGDAYVADPAWWAEADEARAFMTASSDAWGAASIAFGTDPAEARAAAARTTAFYTGAAEPEMPSPAT